MPGGFARLCADDFGCWNFFLHSDRSPEMYDHFMQRTHLLVMAKAPVAGRVKTRLVPPLSAAEAAAVAEAALADTLEAVAACGAERRVLALDGEPGPWLPEG